MKLIYFLIALTFFKPCFSQEKEIVFFNPNIQYTQSVVDTLFVDLQKGRKKIKAIDDLKKILESNNNLLGWPFYYLRKVRAYKEEKYDSVIYYANIGIKSYENSKLKRDFDEQNLLQLNYQKAYALSILNEHKEAIINYQKALDYNKKYPYKWKSFITAGIARSHYEIGNDSLSLKYLLQITKDSLYMNIPRSAVTTYNRIGGIYSFFQDIDKSKYYYNKGLELSKNSNYKVDIASIFGSLGGLYYSEKNIDSTLYYFNSAIAANEEYGVGNYYGAEVDYEFHRAYVKVFQGSLTEGVSSLQKLKTKIGLDGIKTKGDKDLMIMILNTLGLAYQKQGDFGEYENLLSYTSDFLNAFHKRQQQEDLQNLEIKYQAKEKDLSILLLENEQKQQEEIIKQQNLLALSLGGVLILITGLGYLLFRQRKLKNQYEKENLEQRLLRSQMNPHFIGNAMNKVSALVETKSENTIPYINKLSNLFRLVLNNSREEFVSLEEEIITIKSYLELQSDFSKDFDFRVSIEEGMDIEEIIIPPMLIQPFIENAILHGLSNLKKRGLIEIDVSKQNGEGLLFFKIKDNGVGYAETSNLKTKKNHKSLSGIIIKERLMLLKKKFKVNTHFRVNQELNGTSVELYLPYLIDN